MSNVIDIEKRKKERTAIAMRELDELLYHMFIDEPQARLNELSKRLTDKQRGEGDE